VANPEKGPPRKSLGRKSVPTGSDEGEERTTTTFGGLLPDLDQELSAHPVWSSATDVLSSPVPDFFVSTISSSVGSVIVYVVVRGMSLLVEYTDYVMPLENPTPVLVLRDSMTWTGAIAAAVGFIMATTFQVRRLYERIQDERVSTHGSSPSDSAGKP